MEGRRAQVAILKQSAAHLHKKEKEMLCCVRWCLGAQKQYKVAVLQSTPAEFGRSRASQHLQGLVTTSKTCKCCEALLLKTLQPVTIAAASFQCPKQRRWAETELLRTVEAIMHASLVYIS